MKKKLFESIRHFLPRNTDIQTKIIKKSYAIENKIFCNLNSDIA